MDQELKIIRESMPYMEVIYDGISEQGIELDYIMPDYFPDIYRMIKCECRPEIMSYSVNDNKLTYELCACLLIWYCDEKGTDINTVRQKLTYTKTVELGQNISKTGIELKPKTDYINCRVVNRKRIDIKGAVTTRIRAVTEKYQELVNSAEGLGIQLKKIPVKYSVGNLFAEKTAAVSEEFEMNPSKPEIISVIRSSVLCSTPESKIIAGRLAVKGNAQVCILYSCEESGKPSMETMRYDIPYSQIIDMDGIDENYRYFVRAQAVNCDISASEGRRFRCEFNINIYCSASRTSQAEIVSDVYSTRYNTDFSSAAVRISIPPVPVCENITAGCNLDFAEGNIDRVYDVWCSAGNISFKKDEESSAAVISGMLKYFALIRDTEGKPVLIEKENTYEHRLNVTLDMPGSMLEADAEASGCSYSLTSSGQISVTAELNVCGKMYGFSETDAVTDINPNIQVPVKKDGRCALKLYFGNAGESVWDIAKKYSTSVKAVMEENELADEILTENCMILIPIVS